jgi:hypothetical protein
MASTTDNRRTLLNQLVASICWNIIFQNLINLPLEIFLTAYGPQDPGFCKLLMILKYSCVLHVIVVIFFMTLVKYLAVFRLQNPTRDRC